MLIEVGRRRLGERLTTTPDNSARNNRGVIDGTKCDWHHHSALSIQELPLAFANVKQAQPPDDGDEPTHCQGCICQLKISCATTPVRPADPSEPAGTEVGGGPTLHRKASLGWALLFPAKVREAREGPLA